MGHRDHREVHGVMAGKEPMRKCIVKTTTTLGDTAEFGPTTMKWPVDQFSGQTLERLFYSCMKVTVEKDDGTVIVYEPEWSDA